MAWPQGDSQGPAAAGRAGGRVVVACEEAGRVRLQFGGAQRLGGRVAWDCSSGLLAVELQPAAYEHRRSGSRSIPVAILSPQAPEEHFVAHVPAPTSGEQLAALAWSPPGCRRLLLTVTSTGRAYEWTMTPVVALPPQQAEGPPRPAAAAAAAVAAAAGDASGGRVPCINQWYGHHAFDLPLLRPTARSEELTQAPLPPLAGELGSQGGASGQEYSGEQQQQQQQAPRLVCCRFLEPPTPFAAAWNVGAAPPCADRPSTAAEVVALYQNLGLERAFAQLPQAAPLDSPQPPQQQQQQQQLPLHWLRPGLLCVAAVTSAGQLLLACSGRGAGLTAGATAGMTAGSSWELSPAVQLPGVPASSPLHLADVAAAGSSGGLLVAAAAAAAAEALPQQAPQQLLLFEIAGPPAPLLRTIGEGGCGPRAHQQQQQQQQHVARLVLPQSAALQEGSKALRLSFLPGQLGSGGSARLLLAASSSAGTTAAVLTCCSSSRGAGGGGSSGGGLHTWQITAGSAGHLGDEQSLSAAAAVSQDGVCAAVLLPGLRWLHCLSALPAAEGSPGDGPRPCALLPARPPAQLPLPLHSLAFTYAADADSKRIAAAAAAAAAALQGRQPGVAISPNGLYAAVAAPGCSHLLLQPLAQLPGKPLEIEPFMLEAGKRCCYALLTAGSNSSWWDVCSAVASACRLWGHQHLQILQQLVDAAVMSARPEARPRYITSWARLKSALLAAAAAAHPAAAADLAAAAVRADVAAREWLTTAADIFDHHLPEKAVLAAAASKELDPRAAAVVNAEVRAALVKMMPARYWVFWAANFAAYLARCLLSWVEAQQRGGPAAGQAPAAAGASLSPAHQFAAEQNASPDCCPCIRLLSDHQFYRSFSRLITNIHQLQRVLNHLQRSKEHGNFVLLIQQLQLLSEATALIKHLYEAFTKTKQAAEASSSEATSGAAAGAAAGHDGSGYAGYGGAWTLLSNSPTPAIPWTAVSTVLDNLRQQQPNGSVLLARAQHQQQKGGGPQALLQMAAALGLLPVGWGLHTGTRGALRSLQQQRDVALAAAEAGEGSDGCSTDGVPLPLPLPRAAEGLEWEGWQGGSGEAWDWDFGSGSSGSGGSGSGSSGSKVSARLQRQWEAERGSALGLPPDPKGPRAFDESIDVLTSRSLGWEHQIQYAAADGSCATAELHSGAFGTTAVGGVASSSWQAAYAAACPVGGQPWKRLRVA